MFGLPKGTVKVVPYSSDWQKLFEAEKDLLQTIIGAYVLEIEHIGSTAVVGLEAKPILDIAVALRKIEDVKKCIIRLENAGYVYKGENGIVGRHYFSKGEPRTHHLHIVEQNSDFWRTHLLFRDCLRRNPQIAEEYGKLKRELAAKFPFDRESYTNGKTDFIDKVLTDCL